MKIHISNSPKFLTEEFFLFYRIHQNLQHQINIVGQVAPRTSVAAARVEKIIEAKKHNLLLIKDIVDALEPRAEIKHLAPLLQPQVRLRGQNNTAAYLKDFRYMMRDWCQLPEGESQVLRIIKELKTYTVQFSPDNDKILFLGAGMGRIAFEHNDIFNKVFALDKSYSMVHHFHRLLEDDFVFYEINEFNVLKPEYVSRRLTASINNASAAALEKKDRFEYFIGDATELPFEDHSLSCITSVYFSDVIALQLYLEELKRTLKMGGLFIHFGPLDYFFRDRAEMLTGDEIKEEFIQHGFEVMHEDEIALPHMNSSINLTSKVYTNWFFIAKKVREVKKGIDEAAIYVINQPLFIQTSHLINDESNKIIEIKNKDGVTFEGAENVVLLLEFLDGQSTFSEVFAKIKETLNPSNQELELIQNIFSQLLEKGFIKIK